MPRRYIKILLITLLAATLTTAAVGTWWLYHDANNLKFFNVPEKPSGPTAIQICMAKGSGGMERCALAQHKALLDAGINSILICREDTFISDAAKKLGLPIITCCPNRISLGRVVFMPGVEATLRWVIGTYSPPPFATLHRGERFKKSTHITTSPHIPMERPTDANGGTLKANASKDMSGILAIHCHYKREIFAAKKIAPHIPVVLTQHTPSALAKSVRTTADGIVAVSPEIKAALEKQNGGDGLLTRMVRYISSPFTMAQKHSPRAGENKPPLTLSDFDPELDEGEKLYRRVTVIPPFFDDAKFATIPPITDRNAFFKTIPSKQSLSRDNITLKPCPLLVKIAHLYSNVQHKNHPLLFKAMRELIINRHIPVQVALAGKGPMLDAYKKMVRELGIADYVHFLGSTELTPQVLQCADINLLASKEEAFGIVLIEGGLMRKPTIIASGTGAAGWLIIDKQTGFLFKNNDVHSLADTIAYVLKNEDEAKSCGERLHEKVVTEFLPARSAQELVAFYRKLALIHKYD